MSRFEKDGKTILAIDTAGVRNRGSIRSDVEFYSLARAERSIRRADVVLHFFDAVKNISMVDKQLAGYILENFKPAIFVVNKWDLLEGSARHRRLRRLSAARRFPSLDFVPMAFITAKDGKNVQSVLDLAQNLHKQAATRVGTGDLNRVIGQAMLDQSPAVRQNRLPKVYYATQVLDPSADDRPVHQRPGAVRQDLSALLAEDAARSFPLPRRADQALLAGQGADGARRREGRARGFDQTEAHRPLTAQAEERKRSRRTVGRRVKW